MFPKRLRSYLLTLCSSDEPGNRANNFIARLPEPIHLPFGLYDIGLLNMRVTPTNVPSLEPMDAPVGTLFPNLIKPDIIKLVYTVKDVEPVRKIVSDIDEWAEGNKLPLKLTMLMTEDKKLLVHLTNTSKIKEVIILPESIAKLMGFRKRYFPPGQYWSETTVVNDGSVKKGDTFNFARLELKYHENVIKLERLYPEKMYLAYRMQDYRSFIDSVEDELKLDGYNIEIDVGPDDSCELRIGSKSGREDEYVVLPEKLAQALGFTDTKFLVGTYKSPAFNNDVFKTLKNEERLYFEFGRYDTVEISMDEPKTLHHTAVLEELNQVFQRWAFDDLRPVFEVVDGKITSKNLPSDTFITLPKLVDDFFEIRQETVFENDTEVEVG